MTPTPIAASPAFLTFEDVCRITGKKRWGAQCRVLDAKGIPYRRAGAKSDGEPLVRTVDLDAHGKPAHRGHRWDRIGSVRQLRP